MAVAQPLNVQVREGLGKQAAKQTRAAGRVPAVVYAAGMEAIPVSVDGHDFAAVLRKQGHGGLVELDGLPGGKTVAVFKEMQVHPVKHTPKHVDFHAVRPGEACTMAVKVIFKGLPVGVDRQGGVLVQSADKVRVTGLPEKVPEVLVANVQPLMIGDSLHAGDLELPEGCELASSPKVTLASIGATREARSKKDQAEAGEGEAAAPAAKKAPAKKA